MTRPGFRKGRPGGSQAPSGRSGGDGFLSTSLFSQAQILHLMKHEFARARRHGIAMGCLIVQVDRLPQLVDLYGTELRKAVRKAVATLVRDKTRGSDLLGTTNDDRYLLVLPHTNLSHTRIVADRLHQMFAGVEVAVDGRPLALSISIGVTACDDQKTMFFDTLLAQAESALEYAGHSGGNQVVSFGESQLLGADAPPSRPGPSDGRPDDEQGGGTS